MDCLRCYSKDLPHTHTLKNNPFRSNLIHYSKGLWFRSEVFCVFFLLWNIPPVVCTLYTIGQKYKNKIHLHSISARVV